MALLAFASRFVCGKTFRAALLIRSIFADARNKNENSARKLFAARDRVKAKIMKNKKKTLFNPLMAVGAKVILHFLSAFLPFSVLRCCALLLLFPLCTVWSVVCLNCTRKQQTFLNMIVMSVYTDTYRERERERERRVCMRVFRQALQWQTSNSCDSCQVAEYSDYLNKGCSKTGNS